MCVQPGSYYEHVLIEGKRNITIRGCGPRTRVYSRSLQPGGGGASLSGASGITVADVPAVFTIVSSAQIKLEILQRHRG